MPQRPSVSMFRQLRDLFGRSRRAPSVGRPDPLQFLLCIAIITLHLFLLSGGHFTRAENIFLDYLFRQRPALKIDPSIVIIEIDEPSIQAIGKWPWPWSYYAEIIELLRRWEARAIVFDSIFNPSSNSLEDNALEEMIRKAGQVYLPVGLEPKTEKKIWVHSLPIVLEREGSGKSWIHSPAALEKNAKGIGHIRIMPDSDGVMRRLQPYITSMGKTYPYLALPVAFDSLGAAMPPPESTYFPRDSEGNILINWAGEWRKTFEHISYADLVRSSNSLKQGLNPLVNPKKIKDKICLIGLTASGLSNVKVNPLESNYPVLGVHATVINSILMHRFLSPSSKSMQMFCLAAIGLIAALLFSTFRSVSSFVSGLAIGGVWLIFSCALFWQKGIWIFIFQPLLLILSLFIFSTIYDRILSGRERTHLMDLATRDGLTGLYVIRHFREILNDVVIEAHKKKEPLSLILIDIDNFKPVNDTYGHPAGDMVLKKTAQIIFACLRSKRSLKQADFVARYGGEEFIIMLRNASLTNAAVNIAERVRKAVAGTVFQWRDFIIPVTISLGVSTLHSDEAVPDPMVHRADEALYRSKAKGKNRVSIELPASTSH